MIKVIHAAPRGAKITRRRVLTVAPKKNCSEKQLFEKRIKVGQVPIFFDEGDIEGTIQPHDDALVVTVRISSFFIKRVMID